MLSLWWIHIDGDVHISVVSESLMHKLRLEVTDSVGFKAKLANNVMVKCTCD